MGVNNMPDEQNDKLTLAEQAEQDFSEVIDTETLSVELEELNKRISTRVIGQERATKSFIDTYARAKAGIRDPRRPFAWLLIGPTGVGKTELAKQAAVLWLDASPQKEDTNFAFIVPCGSSLGERHNISILIGSPPGYVGYDQSGLKEEELFKHDPRWKEFNKELQRIMKTTELLERVDISPTDAPELVQRLNDIVELARKHYGPFRTAIIFDEIEKADPAVQRFLLTPLQEGELRLQNGNVIDLSGGALFFTSNSGQREIQALFAGKLSRQRLGFVPNEKPKTLDDFTPEQLEQLDRRIYETARDAAKRDLIPELLGRIGKRHMIVLRPLWTSDYLLILKHKFLPQFQSHFDGSDEKHPPILMRFSDGFTRFLVEKGASLEYGARNLQEAQDQYAGVPLGKAILAGRICNGDKILFDVRQKNGEKEVVIRRMPRPKGVTLEPIQLAKDPGPFDGTNRVVKLYKDFLVKSQASKGPRGPKQPALPAPRKDPNGR